LDLDKNFIRISADSTTARKRLALLRRFRSFSQQHVAQSIGVSLRSYQRIEYGERDLDVALIFKIAELFEVNATFFLNPNLPSDDYLKSFRLAQSKIEQNSSEKRFLAQKILGLVQQFENGPIASPMIEQYLDKTIYSAAGAKELDITKREIKCADVFETPDTVILAFEVALQNPGQILITEATATIPDAGPRHMICVSRLANPAWDQMKIDVQFIRVPTEYLELGIRLADTYPLIISEIQGRNVILAPPVYDSET